MLPLQHFSDYIDQNSLFDKNDRILLAVSGGKDSVLMVHFFKQAGFKFGIAHCNFGLRAEESQRDERFVSTLATALEVPLYVTHFQTKLYAGVQKISTQMAARDLRYNWFEEIRKDEGYDKIAVAHHQDDVIETLLLNLVRGTGIAGLHGILPKKGFLVRPLLFMSRAEIDALITANKIEFVEDSSNLSSIYARNKLRLAVIPVLKEINPNLQETFERNIQRFTETEEVLRLMAGHTKKEILEERENGLYLSIAKVRTLRPQQLLLFEILREYHFTERIVEELINSLDKQSGTSFYSLSHRLTVDRDYLIITSNQKEESWSSKMVHPMDTEILLGKQQITLTYSDLVFFEKDTRKAFVDAGKLIFPLIFRTWQEGDRFMPLGMKNYKKLSDFFIDEKVPLPQKEDIPVLVNGNGDIIWLAGFRQDNRYKVTATTKKVAIFEQKFN